MTNLTDQVDFTYLRQPVNKWTFQAPRLKEWVEEQCEGLVLNLFAGMTRLDVKEIRVDSSDEHDPDFNMKAFDFIKWCQENDTHKFDTVIIDPPYTLRKSMEKYDGETVSSLKKIKDELVHILSDDAIAITCGRRSVGMGNNRGFEHEAICLVCHGGAQHDTIVTKQRRNS